MSRLKIKKGFILNEIDGEYIVAATGEISHNFSGYVSLNESGRFLWSILEKGASEKSLYKAFAKEYGLDADTAKEDADAFLNNLKGAGIIE